jgi:hypothetical protein
MRRSVRLKRGALALLETTYPVLRSGCQGDSGKMRRIAGISGCDLRHQWGIDAVLCSLERTEETVGAELDLVGVVAPIEVSAVIADVAYGQDRVLNQLVLNAETPLRDGRCLHVRIRDGERVGAVCKAALSTLRKQK